MPFLVVELIELKLIISWVDDEMRGWKGSQFRVLWMKLGRASAPPSSCDAIPLPNPAISRLDPCRCQWIVASPNYYVRLRPSPTTEGSVGEVKSDSCDP